MRSRGFTMIELVIVLAIMTITLGPLFFHEQKMWSSAQTLVARRSAHEDARQAMARIERDLKGGEVRLAPSLDGYSAKGLSCARQGAQLLRNGVPMTRTVTVDDFVIYRDGSAWVATLAVRSPEGHWTLVSRVPVSQP